jgi:hypothetical protein
MARYSSGTYQPKNQAKYVGKAYPKWRSSWELSFMRFADDNPNVIAWSSESYKIPYIHPFDNKPHIYIPDFFLIYLDANGVQQAEMVEVKPFTQTVGNAKSESDKMAAVINDAKWKYARAYCKQHGIGFRVITEHDIFNKPKSSTKKNTVKKRKK